MATVPPRWLDDDRGLTPCYCPALDRSARIEVDPRPPLAPFPSEVVVAVSPARGHEPAYLPVRCFSLPAETHAEVLHFARVLAEIRLQLLQLSELSESVEIFTGQRVFHEF